MKALLPLVALLVAAEPSARLKPGDEARPFSLPSSTGKTVQLSDYLGKKMVVLAFFPKAFTGG
jgi:peroxiredoxin Q/BCP